MTPYDPPVTDLVAAMRTSGLRAVTSSTVSADDVELAIEEFARFAREVIAPTDALADRDGVSFDPSTATVTVPPAVRHAYRAYVAAGWPAATVDGRHGGGALPYLARLAMEEILCSSNLALSLNPMLTHGSVDLLGDWGTEEQQVEYLPRLVTGEWTGTMNLTEPDAGSDVGAVRTRAVRDGDGTWRLTGTKIFITWGEHDVADNIVHMVLARTPGAPSGTRGISLFVVPKMLRDGTRNAVWCRAVEHKLGIHGSPTCLMELDGAVGELVGEECRGMAAMFTMMNAARLAIAVQGVAVGQRCYEQALAYASERRQGGVAIVEHPDVQRMILDLRSTTRAMRLVVLHVGYHADRARDDAIASARTVALLTPIAKAWCTDNGFRLASVALQVFGGIGYVEETGIAQRLRDSRIAPIYEGTNGIHGIDLVKRKVVRDGGAAMRELFELMAAPDGDIEGRGLLRWRELTSAALDACRRATDWLLQPDRSDDDLLAGATAYLDMIGTTVGGWLLGRHALGESTPRVDEAVVDADFFATEHLPRVAGLLVTVTAGAGRLRAAGRALAEAPAS